MVKIGADVPHVSLQRADDLVGRIEALVSDAHAQGYRTLAYFLNAALIEANIQARQHREDRVAAMRVAVVDWSET